MRVRQEEQFGGKTRFVTRSADNGTPFFENRFLFGTVLDDFSF